MVAKATSWKKSASSPIEANGRYKRPDGRRMRPVGGILLDIY